MFNGTQIPLNNEIAFRVWGHFSHENISKQIIRLFSTILLQHL